MREFISKLTWVDYMAMIAVLRGCYVGYRSGLFPEILRILAYLVTVVLTLKFHETLAQILTLKTFLNQTTSDALSFFVLLVGVFALTKVLIWLLLKLLKIGQSGMIYNLAGMVLGVCRWVILLSLFFMSVDYLPLETLKKDIHERSVVGSKIVRIAPTIFDFLGSLSPSLSVPKNT